MAEGNPQHTPIAWDDLLSTTMHHTHKKMTDNIFNSRPMLNYLMKNSRVKVIDGGISIIEPLIYAEGDAGSYGEWDQLTVAPQQGITSAQFPWKLLKASIVISGLEEAQNNGKAQAINLLEAKIMQAEETFKSVLSRQCYGTQPGGPTAKDFNSLIALVDGAQDVACGGITPTVTGSTENQWWRSPTVAVGAVDAAGLEAAMRNAYNTASDSGSDRVDAMFTSQGVFEFYESTLTPQMRFQDVESANLGFQNLTFKSRPILFDFDCPAGVMLGLNSKYVGMTIHSERNFKQTPFSAGLSGNVASGHATSGLTSSVDARVSFITTFGNLTIRNRRRCFKLTTISEA